MNSSTKDSLILALPAPLVEVVITTAIVIAEVVGRLVEWVGECFGHYTYN